MENYVKIFIWVLLIILFLGLYYSRSKQIPTLSEAINISLSSAGLVTSINLIYLLVASTAVKQILEKEIEFDITAFYLGAIAAGWVSLQPIAQLFKPTSFLGKVERYQIHTGKIIHLQLSCNSRQIYRVVLTEELLDQVLVSLQNNPNLQSLKSPDDLIGKNLNILDVSPIPIGRIHELRVQLPDQIIIK